MKVLYIEDNSSDYRLFTILIEKIDPDIIISHVSSLEAAALVLKEKKYDLIVLDCFLPDSLGPETALQFIRDHKNGNILVLTAITDTPFIFKCMKAGARDYLSKIDMSKNNLQRIIDYVRAES